MLDAEEGSPPLPVTVNSSAAPLPAPSPTLALVTPPAPVRVSNKRLGLNDTNAEVEVLPVEAAVKGTLKRSMSAPPPWAPRISLAPDVTSTTPLPVVASKSRSARVLLALAATPAAVDEIKVVVRSVVSYRNTSVRLLESLLEMKSSFDS